MLKAASGTMQSNKTPKKDEVRRQWGCEHSVSPLRDDLLELKPGQTIQGQCIMPKMAQMMTTLNDAFQNEEQEHSCDDVDPVLERVKELEEKVVSYEQLFKEEGQLVGQLLFQYQRLSEQLRLSAN